MITGKGAALAASAVLLLAGGVLAGYPELIVLGLGCVAALVVAAGWMVARPRLTTVRTISPPRVPEGVPAYGVLTVTNSGRRRSPPLTVTETVAGRRIAVPLPSLPAGGATESTYPLPTECRGRHVLPAPAVGHADPLQLLRTGAAHGRESVLHVYPRTHRIAPLPMPGMRDAEGGDARGSARDGVAFHSLRDYQPGDDWRRIHWPSTARIGTLQVRHHVVPDEPRQLIVLDTSAQPYAGEAFEDATRVAASWCEAAGRAGLPFELRTTGDRIGTTGRRQWDSEMTTALDLLSRVGSSAADRGVTGVPDLVRDLVATGEWITFGLVTGRAAPEEREILAAVRPWFRTITVVHIGQSGTGGRESPAGVVVVDAPTSAEFADRWNSAVPP
ncbi:DUF58 domain-containing protein [Amycolatopsis cihanbeyliensis]|uniref:Uncharacterized protein DUF58 n=1 Tax=Amycolatopsis cihanbeyliensis TaxID=1128664 RepID=A0A542CSE4_AMYCI|nr:DUF58 domain-containing protein [Amycolatopsis cihanbeyliensis]TQI93742.1 uncharacterized protein DUF58 [Amycolatopsis cihanbeyliensis]